MKSTIWADPSSIMWVTGGIEHYGMMPYFNIHLDSYDYLRAITSDNSRFIWCPVENCNQNLYLYSCHGIGEIACIGKSDRVHYSTVKHWFWAAGSFRCPILIRNMEVLGPVTEKPSFYSGQIGMERGKDDLPLYDRGFLKI